MSLTIRNETPNGNSTINSLKVNLPAGYAIDTAHPPTANWTGQITYVAGSGGSVSMSNMSPLKPKSSFVLTLNLNISTGDAVQRRGPVAGNGVDRIVLLWRHVRPGEYRGTSIPANATAVFSTPPSNEVAGTPIPVCVQLTSCGRPAVGTQVTLTVAAGVVEPRCDADPEHRRRRRCEFRGSHRHGRGAVPAGIYTVKATATGYSSISAPVTVFGGDLFCGDPLDPSFTDPANIAPDQPGYSTGNRGTFNKDGSTCIKVPYTFTNTILTNDRCI